MKKNLNAVLAALLTIIILLAVCIHRDIYPFGDQCMLHIDMYHQYCPFFSEFMDKIKNGGSLFYSWKIGAGADFLSLYAYYLASPLNWFLVLVPKTYIIEAMTVLVFVKLALSASFMTHYLRIHFKTEHIAAAFFGVAYALSGYTAAYAWDIMWLDVVALSPLAVLGLERLIDEDRPLLYYVSLAVAILSNFYMGLILCIFMVLWFIKCQATKPSFIAFLRFTMYSILAGGSAAVLIIPTGVVLGSSGSQGISFPDSVTWYFNILEELARFNLTAEANIGTGYLPNIYCGVFAVTLLMIYVVRTICAIVTHVHARGLIRRAQKVNVQQIVEQEPFEEHAEEPCLIEPADEEAHVGHAALRNNITCLIILAFMLISCACNITNFIWHGFHYPNSLPCRQSFLIVFLVLYMAFDTFVHREEIKVWQVWLSGIVIAALMYGGYVCADESVTSHESFVMTAIWLVLYLVIITLFVVGGDGIRNMTLTLGCAALVAELLFNYMQTGLYTVNREAYMGDWSDYSEVLSVAAERSGDSFYRVEKYERKTKNDAALLGYASATQFSSVMNLGTSHFYQKVGMEGGKNFSCYNGATPLLSAMLSVRYMLSDNDLEEGPLYDIIAESGEVYLYENKYILPLGFMMDSSVCSSFTQLVTSDDPDIYGSIELSDGTRYYVSNDADRVNALGRLLGASGDMLISVASVSAPGNSTVYADEDGYYYASYDTTDIDDVVMETPDGRTRNYSKVSHNYMLDLGYCSAGDEIAITNSTGDALDISAYRLDMDEFLAAYDTLAADTLDAVTVTDTKVTGSIDADEDGVLVFSITNEEGWSAYVDGESVAATSFGGTFIAVPVTAGSHTIELSYTSPYFYYGLAISLCCIASFVIILLFFAGRNKM